MFLIIIGHKFSEVPSSTASLVGQDGKIQCGEIIITQFSE